MKVPKLSFFLVKALLIKKGQSYFHRGPDENQRVRLCDPSCANRAKVLCVKGMNPVNRQQKGIGLKSVIYTLSLLKCKDFIINSP
jgi:hypothetical protein